MGKGQGRGRELVVVRVACANCGCESDDNWTGFRALRIDEPGTDDPPQIAYFCLACSIFEFGR